MWCLRKSGRIRAIDLPRLQKEFSIFVRGKTMSERIWSDCTPEQEQALNKLRFAQNQVPGEVINEWAGIDKDIAELERIFAL
jgi:hypothetical protein